MPILTSSKNLRAIFFDLSICRFADLPICRFVNLMIFIETSPQPPSKGEPIHEHNTS